MTNSELMIPPLPRVSVPLRELNQELWAILIRPGPMTEGERAYVEECERNG